MNTFDITIPVLNEEATLKEKVLELHQFLSLHFPEMNWRIVIGDNGSVDQTLLIAHTLEKSYSNIAVISVGEKGVGKALKFAWNRSNADIIGCMDLDLSTDISHVTEAIEALTVKNFDLAYATRLHKNSRVVGRSIKREFTSRSFNFLIRKYLDVSISDGMCGFIFLKKDLYTKLIGQGLHNNKWFFQTELLVMADWFGCRMYELPVKWTDDPNSKVKVIPLALEYLKDMRILKKQKKSLSLVSYEN